MRLLAWQDIAAIVVLTTSISGCQTTAVGTAHNKYLVTWNQRLEEYRHQFVEKDKQIRAKQSVAAANLESAPDPWATLVSRVFQLSIDIRDAYECSGSVDLDRKSTFVKC